ncbi:lycopene cyclase domain-containing protein [Saccharopolyspora sp. CA-218241]|uniref:lycopene cyclase domain-containing protein n=1 Tax=Saccharopolyspora sp. CA-218241 TaxID=3240027 RepID=UPI003D9788BE
MTLDQARYLLILAACVAVTAPLEFFGGKVYRRPVRLAKSLLPVFAVFLAWDAVATAGGVWTFNPLYLSGVRVVFGLPLEEVLFFVVVPICGLLTYGCVEALLARARRPRRSRHEEDVRP